MAVTSPYCNQLIIFFSKSILSKSGNQIELMTELKVKPQRNASIECWKFVDTARNPKRKERKRLTTKIPPQNLWQDCFVVCIHGSSIAQPLNRKVHFYFHYLLLDIKWLWKFVLRRLFQWLIGLELAMYCQERLIKINVWSDVRFYWFAAAPLNCA